MVKQEVQSKLSDFFYKQIRVEISRFKKLESIRKELEQRFRRPMSMDEVIDVMIDERGKK